MNIKCSQRDLLEALNTTSRAITNNTTLPVLNNILIKTEGGKLTFSSTNLEIAITTSIDAEVKAEGALTVPAKLITSYVNYLKNGDVEMSLEKGDSLFVKAAGTKTTIKGIDADEFPSIPQIEKENSLSVDAKKLAQAIEQVVFASATTNVRPVLAGVYFVLKGNELKMVATDSYRLSEKKLELEETAGEGKDLNCIVPSRTIFELGRILANYDGKVEIIFSANQILFQIDRITLISRLIEGQFPDYQQIIPEGHKTKVVISVSELALILKRINLFAKENNNNIKITIDKPGEMGRMVLTTQATQFGTEEDEISVAIEGDNKEIALNSMFILELLNTVKTKEIDMMVAESPLSPVMFKESGEDKYLHFIMPLKV